MMTHSNEELCPVCHQYPVRYQTLKITGDVYAICDNYPECSYVSRLETPAQDWATMRPSA
ncbi:hypothetical protein [Sulfobacillus thermosulfidooxidans]|uniref:hypothetical protein n=1 Tax=Sulfobacillus thermosulfidooxidans TaxID=28034 RepID=UPI000428E20F|nr:hypothetical protein [Sulfobacillus thermosulfidooxidans]